MNMPRDELIEAIYEIELEMFVNVHNVNGKASCQSEIDTFRIMRLSQFKTWPENLLESYLSDLEAAKNQGTNLMSEKYARMMESTFPEEYQMIKDRLTTMTDEKKKLVDKLLPILMDWEVEIRHRYPFLDRRGRPLYAKQDSVLQTSFETYARGELSAYSINTLSCYLKHCENLLAQGINETEEVYQNTMRMYGFSSLEEAAEKYN